MPKKAKKSIARKYKGSSRSEAEIPTQSQNEPSELNDGISIAFTTVEAQMDMEIDRSERSEVTNVRIYDNGSLVLNEPNTPAASPQPGPSGLQYNEMHNPTANVVTMEEPDNSINIEFERKLLTLPKKERTSAKAFKKLGIEDEYEYPVEGETKEEAVIRKHRNANKKQAAQQRQYMRPEDEEIRQQRQQADAERHRRYREVEDEEVRQQRQQAHAEEQSRYMEVEDGEVRQLS